MSIKPVGKLNPIHLVERGAIKSKRCEVVIAHLPEVIGKRQERMLRNKLGWSDDEVSVRQVADSAGPGNVILAEIESESHTEVFSSFGDRNVPSGRVVDVLIKQVREYLAAAAPIGEHLADQLMIPFALAGGGSYRAIKASLHARTNAEVIEQFLGPKMEFFDSGEDGVEFKVG